MGFSTIVMIWITSVVRDEHRALRARSRLVLSYVAATTELVDCAALSERGKLVGFSDLLSGFTGAALALAGGAAYNDIGVEAIAVGATARRRAAGPRSSRSPAAGRRREAAEATPCASPDEGEKLVVVADVVVPRRTDATRARAGRHLACTSTGFPRRSEVCGGPEQARRDRSRPSSSPSSTRHVRLPATQTRN